MVESEKRGIGDPERNKICASLFHRSLVSGIDSIKKEREIKCTLMTSNAN
jgi:hypothetical protein